MFTDTQPSHDNFEQGIIEDRYSDEPPNAVQESWDVLTDYLPTICPLTKTLLTKEMENLFRLLYKGYSLRICPTICFPKVPFGCFRK